MKKDIQYYSFIQGCYLGVVLCLLTIIAYLIDTKLLLSKINFYSVSFLTTQFMYTVYSLKKASLKFEVTTYDFKYYFSICFLLLFNLCFLSSQKLFNSLRLNVFQLLFFLLNF